VNQRPYQGGEKRGFADDYLFELGKGMWGFLKTDTKIREVNGNLLSIILNRTRPTIFWGGCLSERPHEERERGYIPIP